MWYHIQVDTTSGRLAQLVEHLLDVQEVTGSSPVPRTKSLWHLRCHRLFFLLYHPEPARPMLKTRSVGAHSICARGRLPCRKRARADMESAPTFFCGGAPAQRVAKGAVLPVVRASGFIFSFRLVKNHLMWYTISLQVHRQTRCKPATQSYRGPSGQPVANKKLLLYCRR